MANLTLQQIEDYANGLPVPERLLLIERIVHSLRMSLSSEDGGAQAGKTTTALDNSPELTIEEKIDANIPF